MFQAAADDQTKNARNQVITGTSLCQMADIWSQGDTQGYRDRLVRDLAFEFYSFSA